jgi:putative ABC transport system permease protein
MVSIIAFALFGGAVLSQSLDKGIKSLEARLGADIAVVPLGMESAFEEVILTGSPVNFYFDGRLEAQIAGVAGVERVTPQFYLATLDGLPCCAGYMQIIGIDYDTDFVITPWIAQLLHRQLGDEEVIVGSDVVVRGSDMMWFFDMLFTVAARLERTATGMDRTAYVNINTARTLAQEANMDAEYAVSALLVRVAHGYELAEVMQNIKNAVPDVGLVSSHSIHFAVASNLRFFTQLIYLIALVLGGLILLILTVLFSLITSGRKKEFAVLRILGATRRKLSALVLTEAVFLSFIGALAGNLPALLVVFPFGRHMGIQMGMPLLLPDTLHSFVYFVLSLALSTAIGSLASVYSAYKISRSEAYATMREGE